MSSPDSMSNPRVIHIRRSDEDNSFVLLHVSRPDSAALELTITATEGESPYTATVRQSQLKKFRAKNYQGSDEEWRDTVLYVFGVLDEPAKESDFLAGIEASASIRESGEEGKELVISVRKRIQTITQKIGSLTLKQDDEQSIELFEWTNIAIARADSLDQLFNALLNRYRAAEDMINSLNKQLEEFVSSKVRHEQQLMSNFVQLLNEKKLKIRNQQRLLSSAKVDPDKLSKAQALIATDETKQSTNGRGSKRSANTVGEESGSEDGFEKMDVEVAKRHTDVEADEETDDEGQSTPQPIEDEDNTTDDEGPTPPVRNQNEEDKREQRPAGLVVGESPPPRRDLPFTRRAQKDSAPSRQSPAWQMAEGTGGETDDDEL
ncbi:hypothetical protein BJX61DRAFT_451163 [Aspergillus egyptiacus]|nr:hypothetical protein BJX61DRAFT_451163 [Aspergillus egyptiacus]